MINQNTNKLSSTTILIEAMSATSTSRGTGFMFAFMKSPESAIPLLITNKHVLDGADQLRLRFSTSSPGDATKRTGVAEYVLLSGLNNFIVRHPDQDVDLAAVMIAPILSDLEQRGLNGFGVMFAENDIITDEELQNTPIAEEILMIGYPTGLSDYKHNLPIVRKGIIASDPRIPFDGKDHFLIDCACFPGSSGSPVVTKEQNFFKNAQGNLVMGSKRSALMGILWGGPTYNSEGEIIVRDIPTVATPIAQVRQMINLGFVVNAARILDLKNHIRSADPTIGLSFHCSHATI